MIKFLMAGFTSFSKIPLKVLVVEDEPITRTSLAQILDSYFAQINYADDGESGLLMYKKLRPDIIFSDIKMPKKDGISMCKEICGLSSNTPTLILFSAYDNENEIDLNGINVFRTMKKPFNLKALEQLIKEITELHSDKI